MIHKYMGKFALLAAFVMVVGLASASEFNVGDKVDAKWLGYENSWVTATVVRVGSEGILVKYENGNEYLQKLADVRSHVAHVIPFKVGDEVTAMVGNVWYPGVVVSITEKTVRVHFKSDNSELNLDEGGVRVNPEAKPAETFEVPAPAAGDVQRDGLYQTQVNEYIQVHDPKGHTVGAPRHFAKQNYYYFFANGNFYHGNPGKAMSFAELQAGDPNNCGVYTITGATLTITTKTHRWSEIVHIDGQQFKIGNLEAVKVLDAK